MSSLMLFTPSIRIFQVGQRAFSDGREGFDKSGGMSYPDFVYFMLAEEDKSSEHAIKYWQVCMFVVVMRCDAMPIE